MALTWNDRTTPVYMVPDWSHSGVNVGVPTNSRSINTPWNSVLSVMYRLENRRKQCLAMIDMRACAVIISSGLRSLAV